jgi:RNA polymerase sigma-70 factor (ECF subfamily)
MAGMGNETSMGGAARSFPATRWSLVRAAGGASEERRQALDELLGTYWKPLYFFFRRKGLAVEAAKDAVQGLCAHLLEGDFFARPDPDRGRFRSYLRATAAHYLVNQHAYATARKRGGGVKTLPLDLAAVEGELAAHPTPAEDAYEREWALGVMERCLERLRAEFDSGVRRGPFAAVLRYFSAGERPSYEATAREHGLTVSQLKATLHRARRRFRELVRLEVAQTLDDPTETDGELTTLLRALRP